MLARIAVYHPISSIKTRSFRSKRTDLDSLRRSAGSFRMLMACQTTWTICQTSSSSQTIPNIFQERTRNKYPLGRELAAGIRRIRGTRGSGVIERIHLARQSRVDRVISRGRRRRSRGRRVLRLIGITSPLRSRARFRARGLISVAIPRIKFRTNFILRSINNLLKGKSSRTIARTYN